MNEIIEKTNGIIQGMSPHIRVLLAQSEPVTLAQVEQALDNAVEDALAYAEPACECRRVDVDVDDPRDCELHNGEYESRMEALNYAVIANGLWVKTSRRMSMMEQYRAKQAVCAHYQRDPQGTCYACGHRTDGLRRAS